MKEVEEVIGRTAGGKKERRTGGPVNDLARTAVDAVLDKKAHDILVMDMRAVSGVADIFVLCTGDSDLQVKAIADSVRDKVREVHGERPWHVEGYDHRQWVLLDYVDLVVHVFLEERRAFYGLERLWGNAPREAVSETGSGADVALLGAPAAAASGTPKGVTSAVTSSRTSNKTSASTSVVTSGESPTGVSAERAPEAT